MPLMPLHGAAEARVYLTKRDTYTGIHFGASYTQSEVSQYIIRSLYIVM